MANGGGATRQDGPTTPESPGGGPIVLFDGVCNLCNAAVQWLIERDPDGRFRFASLQSDAAGEALAAAGVEDPASLPDSIVLVDSAGVHVRSAAALRIAGALGLPYSLGRAGLILPGPIRDAVYRFVARNRYRWFGRRDACMRPTPDLASRFLDADEPVRVVGVGGGSQEVVDSHGETGGDVDRVSAETSQAVAATTGNGAEGRTNPVTAWLGRLAIVYVILYMLPFPVTLLNYIPGLPLIGDLPGVGMVVGWIVGFYGTVMNPIVTWVGESVFGVTATPEMTGSGDRTFNYVSLAITATLALIGASIWTVIARGRRVSWRTLDVSRVLARYYLATTLLSYGWAKVLPLQFSAPGPDRLLQPYGDSSPMGLAWTFLGASVGYQIFSGVAELIGGYLLFWRRTALVGALVGGAVMINVMAINYFFDVPVKLFSTHLFLVALFIAAPDLPRLVGLFGFNLPVAARRERPFWTPTRRRRVKLGVAHLVLIGTITVFHISGGLGQARSFGFLREQSPLAGIYRVESFERAGLVDRENEDADRWVRVGLNPPFAATIQWATGDAERMRLAMEEDRQGLSFYDRGGRAPETPQFTVVEVEPGLLRLEGTFDGHEMIVSLRRDESGALLTERGYRWINEYPFNR